MDRPTLYIYIYTYMRYKMEKRSRLQATVTNFHDPFRPFPRVSFFTIFSWRRERRPPTGGKWIMRRASEKQAVKSGECARVWNGDLKVSAFSF